MLTLMYCTKSLPTVAQSLDVSTGKASELIANMETNPNFTYLGFTSA